MPDPNDFTDAATAPYNPAWSAPGAGAAANWQGGTSYPGQAQWADYLARYAGNAGALVARGIDAAGYSLASLRYFRSPTGDQGEQARGMHFTTVATAVLQASQANAQARMSAALTNAGVVSGTQGQRDIAAGIMVAGDPRFAAMSGGSLSLQGIQSLYTANQSFGNQFAPGIQDVQRTRRALEGYYGYGEGQAVNYRRTMGMSLDDLAAVTAVTRQRTSGAIDMELRSRAGSDWESYRTSGVRRDAIAAGISGADWDVAAAGGGTTDVILSRLEKSKKISSEQLPGVRKAIGEAGTRRFGTSDLSEEGLLEARRIALNEDTQKTYMGYKSMGFGGNASQLFSELEEQFRGDSLDGTKMRAVQEKIKSITAATGQTLDAVRAFIKTLDDAGGRDLGSTRVTGIAEITSMITGNTKGLTRLQAETQQAIIGQTINGINTSPAAAIAGVMSYGDPAKWAEYQRLAKSTDPADQQKAAMMQQQAIMAPGADIPAALLPALREARETGNWGLLSRAEREYGSVLDRDRMELNAEIAKGAKGDAAKKAQLTERLQKGGGTTFAADGTATGQDPTLRLISFAAGEGAARLKDIGAYDILASYGSNLLGGAGTAEEQANAGALLAQTMAANGGDLSAALTAVQNAMPGLKINPTDRGGRVGAEAAAEFVNRIGGKGGKAGMAAMAVQATTARLKPEDIAKNRRKAAAGGMMTYGKDVLGALFDGNGAGSASDVLLKSVGLTKSAPDIAGLFSAVGTLTPEEKLQASKELDALLLQKSQLDEMAVDDPGRKKAEDALWTAAAGADGSILKTKLSGHSGGVRQLLDTFGKGSAAAGSLMEAQARELGVTSQTVKVIGDAVVHLVMDGKEITRESMKLTPSTEGGPARQAWSPFGSGER